MSSLGKWSCELGVEATENSCLVDDRGRVCHIRRSLQGTDMAKEIFEEARKGIGGSVTAQ